MPNHSRNRLNFSPCGIPISTMMKNSTDYSRGRSGDIHTHCSVTVACDDCGKEWSTQYSNYKTKKKKTPEAKDYCQSCKNRHGISGMKGKKHSDETKARFSEINRGENNPFFGHTHSKEQKSKWASYRNGRPCRHNKPVTDEEKKQRAERTKTYWESLSDEARIARLAKMDFSLMRKRLLCNGGLYSGLHKKVKQDMESLKLNDFQSEESLGKYVVDEIDINRKIAIEINGDYWHANPARYQPDEVIYYPKGKYLASEVWSRDAKKITELESQGFTVHVIWESEVKSGKHLAKLEEIKYVSSHR